MSDDEGDAGDEPADRVPIGSGAADALRKRYNAKGIDDQTLELLELARIEREKEEEEIRQLRKKREQRKREREEEEKRMAEERAIEEARRKQEEEERKRRKEEEEERRRAERAAKLAEDGAEGAKAPNRPNFVIKKKSGEERVVKTTESSGEDKKSKEQLEAEKRAILAQRIQPLNIDGFDKSKLAEKAKDLHHTIYRVESERYDLEKRYKDGQIDMAELSTKARSMNQVGKGTGLKRVVLGPDDDDRIQKFIAGAPAKIEMYSRYERQKDSRTYGDRKNLFVGPSHLGPADKIAATKVMIWRDEGMPVWKNKGKDEGGAPPAQAAPAGEEEEEEEEE